MNRLRPTHASLIALASLVGIIALWLERISGSSIDQAFSAAAGSLLADAALIVSAMTSPTTVLAVVILSGIFAAYEHHARIWWFLSGLLVSTTAGSLLLKQLLALPRPETALIQLTSYGFPSTHTTLATVLFIFGVWLYVWLEGRRNVWITLLAGVAWLAVCVSRILLGVHSISDVLAGILLGVAIGVIAVSLAPQVFKYLKIKKANFGK